MVGRKQELQALNEQYQSDSNSMVMLYGRRGIGKTTLITEFLKIQKGFYYQAKDCSEKEQVLLLKEEWSYNKKQTIHGESYFQIFQSILESTPSTRKTILVIDEVYLAFKQGEMLLEALKQLWEENRDKNNLMVILTSSSVQWVENNMVKMLGSFALYFDEIKKLRHFGFLEIVNRYPELTSRDDVYVYGVLGGVPGYMDLWNPKESIRENIIRLFLDKNALLYNEPSRFLKSELRELAFYNTILSNLASGRQKLNQLYERTGFSRAKISVYLKNLIQLDVVEKVFSYDATNRDTVQKGLYGIKDPLLDFWYRFVFPNLSDLEAGKAEEVYDTRIEPYIDVYLQKYFVQVCKEYFGLMNRYRKLPISYEVCESWYGKEGTIDIVVRDSESNRSMIGLCKWNRELMSESDFSGLLNLMSVAGIEADYYYLFSESGFSDSLKDKESMIDNLVLTDLDHM